MFTAKQVIPNSFYPKRPGVVSGSFGRLLSEAETFPKTNIPIKHKFRQSGVLTINRGKGSLISLQADTTRMGDRVCGPASEPAAALRSQQGFTGKIIFDTPTTVAPTARAAFAGASADSVPTVTVMTPSQSRIATTLTKKRMARRAGRHLVSPYQRPVLYDQTVPGSADSGPFNEGSRNRRQHGSKGQSGNIKEERSTANLSTILQPPNQEDTDITSQFPNPMEPLAPNDPIEQQGNQYSNFRKALRIPVESRDFPVLAANRGLDRNLVGKGPEMGPFDTNTESDARLAEVHGIVWG